MFSISSLYHIEIKIISELMVDRHLILGHNAETRPLTISADFQLM